MEGGEGGINITIIVTASTKKKADKGATFRHVCLVWLLQQSSLNYVQESFFGLKSFLEKKQG